MDARRLGLENRNIGGALGFVNRVKVKAAVPRVTLSHYVHWLEIVRSI